MQDRSYNICNTLEWILFSPHFPSLFDIFINLNEYANEIFFLKRTRSSINLSYDITGSITKCHNDSLGLILVHLWIFKYFSPFFIVSLNSMNMQIR